MRDESADIEPTPPAKRDSALDPLRHRPTLRPVPNPEAWGFSLSALLVVGLIALLTLSARRR
jgi:hypothetical protein